MLTTKMSFTGVGQARKGLKYKATNRSCALMEGSRQDYATHLLLLLGKHQLIKLQPGMGSVSR